MYLLIIGCVIKETRVNIIKLSVLMNKHDCAHHNILQHLKKDNAQECNVSDIQQDVLNTGSKCYNGVNLIGVNFSLSKSSRKSLKTDGPFVRKYMNEGCVQI